MGALQSVQNPFKLRAWFMNQLHWRQAIFLKINSFLTNDLLNLGRLWKKLSSRSFFQWVWQWKESIGTGCSRISSKWSCHLASLDEFPVMVWTYSLLLMLVELQGFLKIIHQVVMPFSFDSSEIFLNLFVFVFTFYSKLVLDPFPLRILYLDS